MTDERISPQDAADSMVAMNTHMLAAHVIGSDPTVDEIVTGCAAVWLGMIRHAPAETSIAIEYGDDEESAHLVFRMAMPRDVALKYEVALAAGRAVEGL